MKENQKGKGVIPLKKITKGKSFSPSSASFSLISGQSKKKG